MKVAQVTYNGYKNYGQILQRYALQKTLEKFADYTEVLWFNGMNKGDSEYFWVERGEIPTLSAWDKKVNPIYADTWFLYEAVRMAKFKDFDERYIKTRFNLPYIEEIADDYDFFVIGSDQVWHPLNGSAMPPTLKFFPYFPHEKRISYAASIANPEIPDNYKEYYRQGIAGFDHVSVREEGALKLITDLGLPSPQIVLDPVFLLTHDEWEKVSKRPSWFNEKYSRGYILTYYLRNDPPSEVKILSSKLNLPVINLLDYGNFNHYTVGLDEFVYLIDRASLIYTNSFHGVSFSILFRKPFLFFEYDNEITKSVSNRIPGLLKMFGLENRMASIINNFKTDSPLEIDYSTRDKVLPQERAKSFEFLANALGVDVPQKT